MGVFTNTFTRGLVQVGSGLNYTEQYKTVLSAMPTAPSSSAKKAQNKFVKSLVDGGVWGKLDWISIFQTLTDGSLINWKTPGTRNPIAKTGLTAYPTHEVYRGYWGNKLGKVYISTEFSPSAHGINYQLNAASIGFYQRDFVFETENLSMGIGNTTLVLAPRYNGNGTKTGVHFGSLNNTNQFRDGSPAGWLKTIHCVTRISGTQCVEYIADSGTVVNINATTIPSGVIDILRCTNLYYETSQISMAWIGGALSDSDMTTMVNAYEAYRHSIGDHNVVIIGDSTSAGTGGGIISRQMDNDTYSCDDLSVGGETIINQTTRLEALPATYLLHVDVVFCMIGLNDISVVSGAESITRYQAMVNSIRSRIGENNKIVGVTMIPCNHKNKPAYISLNEAILGLGATPITGLDSIINTVDTALNDGNGGLAAIYDSGDGLHENSAGSQLIADLYDLKLVQLGLK